MRTMIAVLCGVLFAVSATAGEPLFRQKPAVKKDGDRAAITFVVAAPTDVEVAVLDKAGKVVRHLAAGVLGGAKPPPGPLKEGLAQALEWDGNDDFAKVVVDKAGLSVRVRAGTSVKFGRFLGGEPCNFGNVEGVSADEDGNVYVLGFGGTGNQGHMVLRVFDPAGRYLREIMPFPADLPPGAMKDVASWDDDAQAWRPRNLRNLNPDFYGQPGSDNVAHFSLTLVSASKASGVILTDGGRICRITAQGAVPGKTFTETGLWPKGGALPNSGGGPIHLQSSPDGRYLYLSGPYSAKTAYGHVFDPRFPPGQVYRMEVGKDSMAAFAKLPTIGENPAKPGYGWVSKNISHPGNYTVPHGPVHDIAADKDGNVLVADQDGQRVAVFDAAGKDLGKVDIGYPDLLAVHPKTGALYVLTKEIKGYGQYKKALVKFSGWRDGKKSAELDLGTDGASRPRMALSAGGKSTILWISGVSGGLIAVEDKGDALAKVETAFAPKAGYMADWGRMATDYARDEVYAHDASNQFRRYDGATGEGGPLLKNGKLFNGTDLAVGYDGLLYVRTGPSFSGPFERFTRDLAPAPYPSGTHVISPYIYNRFGVGNAERGIGVGPDGTAYVSFLYKWVAYGMGGFGPDGKPLKGEYLKGTFPGGGQYPPGLDSAIIGPLPQAHAGIRVDLKGNIYLGVLYWPSGAARPKGREKDEGYISSVGSVIKFPPNGGSFAGGEAPMRSDAVTGSLAVYPGLAPFSRNGWGGNTCCVCRTPRFDLDPYGRLIMPNAFTNSVRVIDNAGNLIVEFGKYGNFDSQFANPFETDAAKKGKPAVATPDIPVAWPTCAGFTEKAFYVLDTYNRRALRVEPAYAAEETNEIK